MKKRYARHARPSTSKAALLRGLKAEIKSRDNWREQALETKGKLKDAQSVIDGTYLTMARLLNVRTEVMRRENNREMLLLTNQIDLRACYMSEYETYIKNVSRSIANKIFHAVADKTFKEELPALDNESAYRNLARHVSPDLLQMEINRRRECPKCGLNLLRFMDYRGNVHRHPLGAYKFDDPPSAADFYGPS